MSAYERHLRDMGPLANQTALWGARWFRVHVGEPARFAALPLDGQHRVDRRVHRVADRDKAAVAECSRPGGVMAMAGCQTFPAQAGVPRDVHEYCRCTQYSDHDRTPQWSGPGADLRPA